MGPVECLAKAKFGEQTAKPRGEWGKDDFSRAKTLYSHADNTASYAD